jgi:hypothetical protein
MENNKEESEEYFDVEDLKKVHGLIRRTETYLSGRNEQVFSRSDVA